MFLLGLSNLGSYSYKKEKLRVLVCGNYDEGSHERGEFLKVHKRRPKMNYFNKLISRRELKYWEKLLMVEAIVREHNEILPMFGVTHLKGIKNTYQRVVDLIKDADMIIILLTNYGGAIFEHALTISLKYMNKTYNFHKKEEKFSGMLTKGTFLLPGINVKGYEDDRDLIDKIRRCLDTFKKVKYVEKRISSEEELTEKLTLRQIIRKTFGI